MSVFCYLIDSRDGLSTSDSTYERTGREVQRQINS